MAKGRRVRRVLRKIDTLSVLKVAFLFNLSLTLVVLLASVLVWTAGSRLGVIDTIEKAIAGATVSADFTFDPGQLLRGFVASGAVFLVAATGLAVLAAVIYNLISDVVGGVEMTVLEEERSPAQPQPVSLAAAERRARPEEQAVASGYPA